jgi:hypothetical protein
MSDNKRMPERIVGVWNQINEDRSTNVSEVEFRSDGKMAYFILEDGKWQIFLLTYYLEGNVIVSNQPSAPREERTEFLIDDAGILSLIYGKSITRYRRGPRRAPNFEDLHV